MRVEHAELRALIAELVADLRDQLARRDALIESLTTRLAELERMVGGLQRATNRQAAPFSKKWPKANPRKSGRKPGPDYGPKGHRAVPARRPDRELHAPPRALRDRRENGEVGPAELQAAVAGLDARVESLLARRAHTEENRRLLKHIPAATQPRSTEAA